MPKLTLRMVLPVLVPVLLVLLFPPWTELLYVNIHTMAVPAGNHFLFAPPEPEIGAFSLPQAGYQISVAETILQMLAAGLAGALGSVGLRWLRAEDKPVPPEAPGTVHDGTFSV